MKTLSLIFAFVASTFVGYAYASPPATDEVASKCCHRHPFTNECLCYALDGNCQKWCPTLGG